ncbi:hypothetical protein HTZ77_21335 [Nonomuraea sp. SMC257]|uniref:DUF2493 domain-containing protein n=1 Tax=Nonomuraea montanisoli TaxID=2741721 RepID=A0A7Y6I9D8_9ACTN|nr:hypothetical protein [Nonomuraea montanisoli]NUW33956.1 hypothetical protein [Nonomuraea montanisoli]
MSRIAFTGHRGLPPETAELVDGAIREALAGQGSLLVGLSCLADGADQIFARAVLDLGGSLEAVVPAEHYREALPEGAHPAYDELYEHAARVHRLPFVESTSESHLAAGRRMLDGVDELLAVWDGLPARGAGGTADVVAEARHRGIPVHVVWPRGAHRD